MTKPDAVPKTCDYCGGKGWRFHSNPLYGSDGDWVQCYTCPATPCPGMVPLTEEGIMELVHASDMLFSKRVHRAIRSLQAEVAALRSRCEDLDSFMRAGNDQRVDMIRRAESAEAQVAALKVRLAEAERILDLEAKGEIVAMEARASAAEARVEVLRGVLTDIAITDPDAGNPSRFLVSLAKNALAEPKAEGAGE